MAFNVNALGFGDNAKPEDGLTVDGVIVAAYAPVYVRGRDGKHWPRA